MNKQGTFQLPKNSEQFNFKDCIIAGDECVLVTPKDMGVEWTEENKYFRSSIWRKSDMHPVSLGFRKFMNYGEKPDFEPIRSQKVTSVRKIDGSCLIVSKYKEQLIIRTRGTVDATKLENGNEIAHLILKYPLAFDNHYINRKNCTLLFEWTTPSNRIVLKETEDTALWLIGMIYHRDGENGEQFYSYASQHYLDLIAEFLGVKRPETYAINLFDSIENIKKQIEPLTDIEGVVIYDETGQVLKKIKTLRYLQLHRVFTGVKNINHIFELFVEYGGTYQENFETLLATNFDWELVESIKPLINEFYSKWNTIKMRLGWIELCLRNPDFIELDRKGKAQKILENFPNCSGIAFAMLDNKNITLEKIWKTFNA